MFLHSQNQLRNEIWFVNAGILSQPMYIIAIEDNTIPKKRDNLFSAIIFLSIDYLIHYFELLSINFSKLLINCIKRHLHFVEKLLTQKRQTSRYMSVQYWDAIVTVCEKLSNTEDFVEKQFCVDALERICIFFTSRTRFWVRNFSTLTYLKIYGRNTKNAVVYNSFLIPNFAEYKDSLCYRKQKIFEKIENDCCCRIQLNIDQSDCRIGEKNIVLEVIFDYYKGNFVGFLDCLSYLVKRINPSKYFIKSLRTITQNGNFYFSILSDLPLKELVLIEKTVHMGELIAPFLKSSASSKVVFNLLREEIKELGKEELEKSLEENEDFEYWKKQLSGKDVEKYKEISLTFLVDFQCLLAILWEWSHYKVITDRKPKRHFSAQTSSLGLTDLDSKNITDVFKPKINLEYINSTHYIEEQANKLFIQNNDFDNTRKIKKGLSYKSSGTSVSVLSIKIDRKDSTKESNITKTVLPFFEKLYDRKYHLKDQPNNLLNHTLRVMLRCSTEYEDGDAEIALLENPACTIHDILKQFYNFDLRRGTFFTEAQRRMSLLNHELVRRKKEMASADELQEYLENRRIVAEQIENATGVSTKYEHSIQDETLTKDILRDDEQEIIYSDDIIELYEPISVAYEFLFADYRETKELLSPEFKKDISVLFGSLNSDILQMFNEKRIESLSIWIDKIKGKKERFYNLFPIPSKPVQCNATTTYKSQIKPDQIDMIYNSVNTNVFVSIKLLSGHEAAFDDQFQKILKGQGIITNFLNEINKTQANLPKFLSLLDRRKANLKKELNHILCVMSFDIYLICASLSSSVGNFFDYHRKELNIALVSSSKVVQDLYKLFEFEDKLDEAKSLFKVRFHNRTKEEISKLLKLSLDLRRFNEFLFHSSCCKWSREKSIRIIYASMHIDGKRRCQEPFLRHGGDRRLKKIENKANCIITMRLITNPATGVNFPFVEIFYDFFKGNHFCAMDMLRKVLINDHGAAARITNLRHLICLPYGELWIIQDLEWLKTRAYFMLAQE